MEVFVRDGLFKVRSTANKIYTNDLLRKQLSLFILGLEDIFFSFRSLCGFLQVSRELLSLYSPPYCFIIYANLKCGASLSVVKSLLDASHYATVIYRV